jgi:putative hydrolase of HD superfamily
MPFVVNLACEGRNWMEQSISRSQVLKINEPVQRHAPEVFEWMKVRIEECVQKGWLKAD